MRVSQRSSKEAARALRHVKTNAKNANTDARTYMPRTVQFRSWQHRGGTCFFRHLLPGGAVRRERKFARNFKLILPVQSPLQKYFPFPVRQIRGIGSRVLSRKRGVAQRHQRGAGCGGRGCAFDEQRRKRTAKSCGPDASTPASSSRNTIPRMTVTRKPDRRGEHEATVKTTRVRECRVNPVRPW